jgi:hypothetical protein
MQRTIPNSPSAIKIGNVPQGSRVHFQVFNGAGAITCRFANRQEVLDNALPFGGDQGFAITSADGLVELVWEGEVWAKGNAVNAAQPLIEFGFSRS